MWKARYFTDNNTNKLLTYNEAKTQGKLYRCCNSCKHFNDDNFYKCNKPKECYNGFSAYEPNEDMIKQEINNIK